MVDVELKKRGVYLGKTGETGRYRVWLDVSAWDEEYEGGVGLLLYTDPKGNTAPMRTVKEFDGEKTKLYGYVTAEETKEAGTGVIEVRWENAGVVAKSDHFNTVVMASSYTGKDIGENTPDWVSELMTELNAVNVVLDEAAQVAEDVAAIRETIEGAETVAKAAALDAEAWAVGERDGEDVDEDDPTYGNNARKYAQDAGGSAAAAGVYKLEAEAWAKGTKNGQAVPSTDPAYQKNAKYYAEQAFSGTPEGYADLVGDVGDLKSAIDVIEDRMVPIDGIITMPTFENGSVYANNGVLEYSNNAYRIRMPRNTYLQLEKGDLILIDTGYSVGVNYSTDNGATYVWEGGTTVKYTAPYNGRYVLFIQSPNEITDVKETESHVTVKKSSSLVDEASEQLKNVEELIAIPAVLYDGYYSSGGTVQPQGVSKEKYTQKYTVTPGMYFNVNLRYIESAHDAWNAACEWLSDGTFYRRQINSETGVWGTYAKYTPGNNVVSVAFVFRGFDDFEFSLSTTNINFLSGVGEVVAESEKMSDRVNVVENIFRFKPFYSHLGVDQTTDIVVPCQSLSDVLRAKRLGFNAIELNVQKTNDNKYVCLHGTGGKFGSQFIGADSSVVSDIKVSDKTLDWIKTNVRYVSKYPIYQTAPYTLEEMLYECKKLCVVPLVQYVDMDMVKITNKIMGANNYVMLLYSNDRDNKTNAVCMSWTAIADINDAIDKCNASGKCYILGVNHGSSVFSNFTDADWETYINAIHESGYYIGGAYINADAVPKFRQFGWDVIASTAQINEIDSGNICNLFSDLNYTDFSTDGTVSNGTLTLSVGQRVTPNATYQSVFLGGGSLHIRFSGSVYVNMGKINISYTSDGENDVWFSTYFEEQVPTFTVTAATGTVIYELSYKASRM